MNRILLFSSLVYACLITPISMANQELWDAAYQKLWDRVEWLLRNDKTAKIEFTFKDVSVYDLITEAKQYHLLDFVGAVTETDPNAERPPLGYFFNLDDAELKNSDGVPLEKTQVYESDLPVEGTDKFVQDIPVAKVANSGDPNVVADQEPSRIRGGREIGIRKGGGTKPRRGSPEAIALESLMEKMEYVPTRFEPLETDRLDLCICSRELAKLEGSGFTGKDIGKLAYLTFVLGNSILFPNETLSVDCAGAISQYNVIAHKLGYCSRDGVYLTAALSASDFTLNMMTHDRVEGIPNFLRAYFLAARAYTKTLPSVLNRMQDHVSIHEFDTRVVEFYSHVAKLFIPNLCTLIRTSSIRSSLSVLTLTSKLVSDFPSELFPQTVDVIETFNQHILANLRTVSFGELFEVLKVNEYAEVCHDHTLLSSEQKVLIIRELAGNKAHLNGDQILTLMRMQYTLFFEQQELFRLFRGEFASAYLRVKKVFEKAQPFSHELELLNVIKANLDPADTLGLAHSHVCVKVGREIDIAYIRGASKIAIHIDGGNHYYLDRQEQHRSTRVRNKALENAGWTNICQPLPAAPEGQFMVKEKRELLERVEGVLPLQKPFVVPAPNAHPVPAPVKVVAPLAAPRAPMKAAPPKGPPSKAPVAKKTAQTKSVPAKKVPSKKGPTKTALPKEKK